MKQIYQIVGLVVLTGIIIKLSYVFIFLFKSLDGGSLVSMITGVTFAFASIYFVMTESKKWLKLLTVFLDVATIIYFYMHEGLGIPVYTAAIIVAAYSGLVVYFLGSTLAKELQKEEKSQVYSLSDETLKGLLAANEQRRKYVESRLADAKSEEVREKWQKVLNSL